MVQDVVELRPELERYVGYSGAPVLGLHRRCHELFAQAEIQRDVAPPLEIILNGGAEQILSPVSVRRRGRPLKI